MWRTIQTFNVFKHGHEHEIIVNFNLNLVRKVCMESNLIEATATPISKTISAIFSPPAENYSNSSGLCLKKLGKCATQCSFHTLFDSNKIVYIQMHIWIQKIHTGAPVNCILNIANAENSCESIVNTNILRLIILIRERSDDNFLTRVVETLHSKITNWYP